MSTTYFLSFLVRGEKWTADDTPETRRIQDAHMKNILRMAEDGKLVAAGPFLDNGKLWGIFVFKVESLAEATELTEADPAVRAGRLAMEVHPWPWSIPKGVFP